MDILLLLVFIVIGAVAGHWNSPHHHRELCG